MKYVSKLWVAALCMAAAFLMFSCQGSKSGSGTPPRLQSIQVTPANPAVDVGTSTQLIATGTYPDSSQQNISSSVTWTVSDNTRATINSTGLATGSLVGTTMVIATDPATGITGTTVLTVTAARTPTLPDTGQTTCHTGYGTVISCAGTGQDGLYSVNTMSFTDNGDYTVTDNVTGLMWQRCSAGQTNDSLCSGSTATYNWYVASGTTHATYNPGSTSVCSNLTLGGHNDWRLPEKTEMIRLMNYGTSTPALDSAYFPNATADLYWTSNTNAGNASTAWYVGFSNGTSNYTFKTTGYSVRCVRGSAPTQSFTDNGNGTVTDTVTGLMWQKCSYGEDALTCSGAPTPVVWSTALDYCNSLTLAGYTVWRLPNIKELESLVDIAAATPAVNAVFPGVYGATPPDGSWSSTTQALAGYNYNKWAVSLYYGHVFSFYYTNNLYVRCVR